MSLKKQVVQEYHFLQYFVNLKLCPYQFGCPFQNSIHRAHGKYIESKMLSIFQLLSNFHFDSLLFFIKF